MLDLAEGGGGGGSGGGVVALEDLMLLLSSAATIEAADARSASPPLDARSQAGRSVAGDGKSVAGRSERPSETPTRATGMGGVRRAKVDPKELAEKQRAEVEAEAERLALCDYAAAQLEIHAAALDALKQAEAEQAEVARAMRRAAEAEAGEAEGGKPTQRSSRPTTGTSRPFSAGGRKTFLLDNLPPPAGDFVLASYVIDFGNVIKGSTRKKSFRIRNIGWQAISFDLDKIALANAGIKVAYP